MKKNLKNAPKFFLLLLKELYIFYIRYYKENLKDFPNIFNYLKKIKCFYFRHFKKGFKRNL